MLMQCNYVLLILSSVHEIQSIVLTNCSMKLVSHLFIIKISDISKVFFPLCLYAKCWPSRICPSKTGPDAGWDVQKGDVFAPPTPNTQHKWTDAWQEMRLSTEQIRLNWRDECCMSLHVSLWFSLLERGNAVNLQQSLLAYFFSRSVLPLPGP